MYWKFYVFVFEEKKENKEKEKEKETEEFNFTVIIDFGNKTKSIGFVFYEKPGGSTTHCQAQLDRDFKKRYSYYSQDNEAVIFDRHFYNISQNKEKVLARNVLFTNALSDSLKVTMGTWPDVCPQLWHKLSEGNQNMSVQHQHQQQQLLPQVAHPKCVCIFFFFFSFEFALFKFFFFLLFLIVIPMETSQD